MLGQDLLKLIWAEHVQLPSDASRFRFEALFARILPVRMALLLAELDGKHPLVLHDGVEVGPGLPLGDVLVEELPIDLPYDTLVIALPQRRHHPDQLLGSAVAEALIVALDRGDIPMERETEALHGLAQAALKRAATLQRDGEDLDLDAFTLGVSQALGRHWMVPQSIIALPNMLSQASLQRHLERLDPGFRASRVQTFGASILDLADGTLGFGDWCARTSTALRCCLGAPKVDSDPVELGLSTRFNFH